MRAIGLLSADGKGLRRAHATALLKAGTGSKVVEQRLGHWPIAVFMDIHSSVLPRMQREAIERLTSTMGSS